MKLRATIGNKVEYFFKFSVIGLLLFAQSVVVVSWVCCLFVAQEPSVVVERERERTKITRLDRTPRPLLNCDDRQSTITSLARRRIYIFEPKRHRCRTRPLGNGKRGRVACRTHAAPRFLLSLLASARSCGGALLMACAPCSALCA